MMFIHLKVIDLYSLHGLNYPSLGENEKFICICSLITKGTNYIDIKKQNKILQVLYPEYIEPPFRMLIKFKEG